MGTCATVNTHAAVIVEHTHAIVEQRNVFIRTWGHKGSADGEFDNLVGVAVGMNDVIYVSDRCNHRIQCFHSNGTFIRKWGSEGRGDSEFNQPEAIAIGVWNGIHQSIVKEMSAVPELYAFPPGVLPICVMYVGEEEVYVCDAG